MSTFNCVLIDAVHYHDCYKTALDQALNEIIGNTCLRIIVLNGLDETSTRNLKKMRPNPSNFAIFGSDAAIIDIVTKVSLRQFAPV